VSSLKSDYYQHDAKQHRLVGDRSGQVYGLGDRVRVKVVRVNLDERKIDLELVAAKSAARAGSTKKGNGAVKPAPAARTAGRPTQKDRRKRRP
jgi:ribonuclease R